MGFLSWFKNNLNEEESTGSQLDLLGESKNLPERRRVDGVTVRKKFNKTIQDKGGSGRCQARSTEALTQEVLGCSTKDLYEATGAKQSKRETLPDTAQEALMTGEIVATHDLKGKDVRGNQSQRNTQIEDSVRASGKKVRKWFPW